MEETKKIDKKEKSSIMENSLYTSSKELEETWMDWNQEKSEEVLKEGGGDEERKS